ncbi:cytochrome c biogenesis protein ResB [Bhargavaea ullalensis]|uniref:Cytochrome c biogenesis protein n=1 Tax=Bhargavaea ullalensis TaxID=1265685 RepID=A0ABV2GA03_9BACL
MSSIKCECGHVNPEGTDICQNCGRPLSAEEKEKRLADMRYDGAAIRSMTHKRSIVDKVWNFFSSVKIGVSIIIAILVAAAIGTFLPQVFYVPAANEAQAAQYYEEHYGTFGKIYNALGLSDLYGSWWFMALVGLLGISLVVVSLDRGIPLYKSLKNQRTARHPSFMKRQRLFGEGKVADPDAVMAKAKEKLKEERYRIKEEDGAILAEKGRWSRWGPYVNHAGLIIFLLGVMLRALPGFYVDESMWIREGETLAVKGAPGLFIENKGFSYEVYSKDNAKEVFGEAIDRVGTVASKYQTDVALYKQPENALPGSTEKEYVKDYSIVVNKPLKYEGYSIFQMDFKLDELKSMTFALENKETEKPVGELTIDLANPEKEYDLGNGSKVRILDYYPDFSGFEDGEPQSATPIPNNPAFLFKMFTPEKPEGETSFVAIRQTLEPLGENEYRMAFQNADTRNVSGLTIRKDKTIPIISLGGLIFLLGVAQSSYFNHRRFWIRRTEDGKLLVAGHTNKNWVALKRELDKAAEYAGLPKYSDQRDPEEAIDANTEGDSKA